jgi:hypothetical protein
MNGSTTLNTQHPRRVWPWVLGATLLLVLLAAAAGVSLLVSVLNAAHDGVHVVINGETWDAPGLDALLNLSLFGALGVAGAALVLVAVVVPLALLLALLGTVLGLGLALAGVVLVVALALSPLWLVVLVLWLLLRRKPAARMAA